MPESTPSSLPPANPADWPRVLRPRRPLFSIPWGELWHYRDLTRGLAARDITTSYKQTVLGPLWFVVQPLMITAVYSYLFGRMAGFGSDDIPHFLFYMSGLVLWTFFAEATSKTSNVFVENAQLFSKVYFPRLSVPLASIMTNCIPTLVQLGLFILGWGVYLWQRNPYVNPQWALMLLTPLLFLQLAVLALGLGCIVSALSRRFRDMAMGMRVFLQLLMFGSAIVFPLSRLQPNERWLFLLNPVVPPVEFFRLAFLGKSYVEPWHLLVSAGVSLVLLFIGLVLFNRAEQNAMDTV